jgi:hypothetical protein
MVTLPGLVTQASAGSDPHVAHNTTRAPRGVCFEFSDISYPQTPSYAVKRMHPPPLVWISYQNQIKGPDCRRKFSQNVTSSSQLPAELRMECSKIVHNIAPLHAAKGQHSGTTTRVIWAYTTNVGLGEHSSRAMPTFLPQTP